MPYIYAFSGMVWWKEVSNTATIGVSGPNTVRQARMAAAWGGLWRGPSSEKDSMSSITFSVMRVETL